LIVGGEDAGAVVMPSRAVMGGHLKEPEPAEREAEGDQRPQPHETPSVSSRCHRDVFTYVEYAA
jgi:hypothetical protein